MTAFAATQPRCLLVFLLLGWPLLLRPVELPAQIPAIQAKDFVHTDSVHTDPTHADSAHADSAHVRADSLPDARPRDHDPLHEAERSLSFLVIGDWGYRGGNAQRGVANRMAIIARELDSRFVITTGDNFYYDGVRSVNDRHWQESFERIYSQPSLQGPWYITLGNHDYQGDVNAQIEYSGQSDRWTLPARYYSVVQTIDDTTSVRFVFLDTPQLVDADATADAGGDPGRQLGWLDRTLAASTSQWNIVVGHHPMFTGSRAANPAPVLIELRAILERHDVQAYVAGHDHDLQHLRPPGGIDYFISGAAGNPRESGTSEHTVFAVGETPGIMAVSLSPKRMDVRFVDSAGTSLYRTSILRNDLVLPVVEPAGSSPGERLDALMAACTGDSAIKFTELRPLALSAYRVPATRSAISLSSRPVVLHGTGEPLTPIGRALASTRVVTRVEVSSAAVNWVTTDIVTSY